MTNPWKGKNGPLLIAEIGGNHEGDFEYAKKLTQLAIESNVDYIKFQLYSGDSLVSPIESPTRNKHFKKFQLSNEQHIELAEMCKAGGIGYMASVWNLDYIDWIDQYMNIYKIGSGDLNAYQVLRGLCKLEKPIILSTGLSTLEEVKETVEFIQSENSIYKKEEYLSILQCTSMYPIPMGQANLNVMNTFQKEFNLPVGYSDHTVGYKAMLYAVAAGAEILEFHFTDTREGKEFRDHQVSLVKDEVLEMIEEIKLIKEVMGTPKKEPTELEVSTDHVTSFRRALYLNKDLKQGDRVSLEDVVSLRPNVGIDARQYDDLIGKTVVNPVKAYHKLDWADFE